MLIDIIPLIPLLERFEAEHGTLVSAALFFGREIVPLDTEVSNAKGSLAFSTLPGFLYILFDHMIWRANHVIQGARYTEAVFFRSYTP